MLQGLAVNKYRVLTSLLMLSDVTTMTPGNSLNNRNIIMIETTSVQILFV